MKYFTPDLYARLQDTADEQQFRATTAAWEKAVNSYGQHLQQLSGKLSRGLQRLVELGSLHDCAIVGLWQGKCRLTILLQRELPGSQVLALTYSLLEPPAIDEETLPHQLRSTHLIWLYDEIDIEPGWVFDRGANILVPARQPTPRLLAAPEITPIFTQEILLSNGWEIRLRFDRLRLERLNPLIVHWPESATLTLSTRSA